MTDETRWDRVTALFDRLLGGEDTAAVLQSEPDDEIRKAALDLWSHHVLASQERFLGDALSFEVRHTFRPGQILVNRFQIEKMLGSGGMGEVYLAWDRRMDERVAVKTIARLLAPSPSLRHRIVAEVQSARRVTHPNVCRIHELFEDGETVFFSMEYLPGVMLHDLNSGALSQAQARALVRQLAEGLYAAHQTGVVHGDFKPANVMVLGGDKPRAVIMDFGLARALDRVVSPMNQGLSIRAGTVDYMAPELHGGGQPTVRSDIFAFGKVAAGLLPGERIWADCTRPRAEDRLASLEPVIRRLEPRQTRRLWIAGSVAMAAGGLVYALRPDAPRGVLLPDGMRVLVNRFQAAAGRLPGARLARALLLTALRQSPRIRPVADQDLLPALRRLQVASNLPVSGQPLRDLLAQLRATFWIDADLQEAGERTSLHLRVMRSADQQMVAQAAFRDVPGIAAVAQQAALWLRTAAGESPQSLAANPVTVTSYTSRVPEALEKYYDAMEHYAVAEMAEAVPLLEEAVRLDPGFAQARSMLGVTLNASGRFEEAFSEVQRAMQLANGLPERERAWIETNYFMFCEDPVKMVEAARRNVAYYPDEPRYYNILARYLCRSGNPESSIPYNRKSLELAPDDGLSRADLIYDLAESGLFAEALAEFQGALSRGTQNDWIYEAGGLAYLGLERYAEAFDAFARVPSPRDRGLDQQGVRILQGDLESARVALEERRAGATGVVDAHRNDEFLCGLYFLNDQPDLARRHLHEMVNLPPYPAMARRLDCTLFWAARLGDDEILSQTASQVSGIAGRWPNLFTRAVALHAQGLVSWRRGAWDEAEQALVGSAGSAFSIWTLFDLADFYGSRLKPSLAEDYWRKLDAHRGTILERWFPGALIMAWLNRARAASAGNNRQTARTYSEKVLDHWSRSNPGLSVVRTATTIRSASNSL